MRTLIIAIVALAFMAAPAMAGVGNGVPTSLTVTVTVECYVDMYWHANLDLTGVADPMHEYSGGDTVVVSANAAGSLEITLTGDLTGAGWDLTGSEGLDTVVSYTAPGLTHIVNIKAIPGWNVAPGTFVSTLTATATCD